MNKVKYKSLHFISRHFCVFGFRGRSLLVWGRGHERQYIGATIDLALVLRGHDLVGLGRGLLLAFGVLVVGSEDGDLLSLELGRSRLGRGLEEVESLSVLPIA